MNKKEKRAKKIRQQRELFDAVRSAKRDMTAEESEQFNSLQREIDELTVEINEEERDLEIKDNSDLPADLTQERQRITDINMLCREFGVKNEEVDKFINNGNTVDEVRAAIIETMRNNGAPINTSGRADVTKDEADKYRAAAADALVMRGGVEVDKPEAGARDLMHMSLRDLAIDCIQRETGEANLHKKSNDEIFNNLLRAYFNPTAAFPAILDTAINKAYVEGHNKAAVTFDKFCKKGSLKDFKTHDNNYLAGPAGEFLEVPEGGEIKHDLPTDGKLPSRKLKTYGRQFTMTRQAFINDDIDFLSKIPAKYAASARKTQNKQAYEILVKNPIIYDGTTLFNSAHKNVITTGTGITLESLQKMFMALQLQTDQFGEAIIIRPATIVCPVGYGFTIATILDSPTINTTGNTQAVNPLYAYRNQLTVVEDPTLNVMAGANACPWFVFGAKEDTDGIEIDYLNGLEIPTIRRMETPGSLGLVWDIYLDWGFTVMDFRGIIKNPGIALTNPLA